MRAALALLAVGLGLALPLPAGAEEGGSLAEARAAMERLEYGDARRALERALSSGRLEPAALAEAYRRLAECFAALRMPDRAREAYVRLLAVQPGFEVPGDQSPLVRTPFEEAAAFWQGKARPGVRYRPPTGIERGEPRVVEPELERGAVAGLATEVTLHLQGRGGDYSTFVGAEGRIEVSASDLEGRDAAVFYLALRDEHGNVVALAGSAERPLEVEIEEDAAGPEEGPAPAPGRPWYGEWWLWTAVSVVVVGLAVGLPVGLVLGGAGDPCDRAFGGACDLTASFGE